jgi:hypothetical protein
VAEVTQFLRLVGCSLVESEENFFKRVDGLYKVRQILIQQCETDYFQFLGGSQQIENFIQTWSNLHSSFGNDLPCFQK